MVPDLELSRVFISYVREDKEAAERLYQDLTAVGAAPWIANHDLLGGQGWRGVIKQIIRRSSHFIALISRNSIAKRGYAQSEIHEALEALKEIPPDEIYLIPVRLDDVESPFEQLRDLHQVDLFPSYAEGLEGICRALLASGGIDSRASDTAAAASRDAARLESYRRLFDRPAFRTPCIFEFALREVQATAQDISASMATGKLYSHDGRLLMEVPPASTFETPSYQTTLQDIRDALPELRRTSATLASLLCDAAQIAPPEFEQTFFHMEFFLLDLIKKRVKRDLVEKALGLMDRVDMERNTILKRLNSLLRDGRQRTMPYITLSSVQLKRSEELEMNEGKGPQLWEFFYLRTHRMLSKFLSQLQAGQR